MSIDDTDKEKMSISLDDINANVEISGDGYPLIMLHGSFCNTLLWEPQSELADRFRLVKVDLRGHGGTPCPVTARSFDRSLDIIQVMDSLNIDKAYFCGLSMGGPIALQIALDYPERCLGIILLATGPGPGDRPVKATEEMRSSAETEAKRLIELGVVEYFYSSPAATSPGVKEFLERRENRVFFERMLSHNDPLWLADSIRMAGVDVLPGQERLLTSHRVRRLHEIDTPVLYMVGSLDQVFMPVADLFGEKIKNCQIEIVSGTTHLINIDASDIVNSRIERFTSDLTK